MNDTNLCNGVSLMWRLCRQLTFNFSKCGFWKKKIVYKLIYKYICTFQIFKKFFINFQFCLLEVINEKKVSVKVLRIICCMLCYIYPSPSPRFFLFFFWSAAALPQCYQILPCTTSPCPPTLRTGHTHTAHFVLRFTWKSHLCQVFMPHLRLHQTFKT